MVLVKKAKEGASSLSYDATFGIRQAMNLIEPLNAEEQLKMRQLSYANAGLSLPGLRLKMWMSLYWICDIIREVWSLVRS